MTVQIYLASRYSRRVELAGYRERINAIGHTVQARWLDGDHQISDTGVPLRDSGGESLVEGDDGSESERAVSLRTKFAKDDLDDVSSADLVIAFTEPPRSGHSRGGRHVELGIAIGLKKKILVVGHRENLFCFLPQIAFRETIEDVIPLLTELRQQEENLRSYPTGTEREQILGRL